MNDDPRREWSQHEIYQKFPAIASTERGLKENLIHGEQVTCIHCGYSSNLLDTRGFDLFEGLPVACGCCGRHAWTVMADGLIQVRP